MGSSPIVRTRLTSYTVHGTKMRSSTNRIIHLADGQVVLYRRPETKAWQARIKHGTRWFRVSTKAESEAEARAAALQIWEGMNERESTGLSPVSRGFGQIAQRVIARLKALRGTGQWKVVYDDYIRTLKKYHIEFFKNKDISTIMPSDIDRFENWRSGKIGRTPSVSTLNTHNTALRLVFEQAISSGFLSAYRVPEIKNNGRKGERRSYFTPTELHYICDKIWDWAHDYYMAVDKRRPRKLRQAQIRVLAGVYVRLIAYSGIRPGTEALGLRWSDISKTEPTEKAGELPLIAVNGKTGFREVVCQRNAEQCFIDLEGYFQEWGVQQLPPSRPLFMLPDGTMPKDFHGVFQRFLKEHDLLVDKSKRKRRVSEDGGIVEDDGEKRTLYSLRHSYATVMLLQEDPIDMPTLASNMGTSVQMIEKHYSHLQARMRAHKLAGIANAIYKV